MEDYGDAVVNVEMEAGIKDVSRLGGWMKVRYHPGVVCRGSAGCKCGRFRDGKLHPVIIGAMYHINEVHMHIVHMLARSLRTSSA